MPLVHISYVDEKRPPDFGRSVGRVVYDAMRETINVPANDNFQILNPLKKGDLVYDPSYLNVSRTEGLVVIEITLNEGRTVDLKKNLYRTVADQLHAKLGIRREDVLINLIEVKKENWSFGNGEAPYAPKDPA